MYGNTMNNNYAQPQHGQTNLNNSHINSQFNPTYQDENQRLIQAQVTRPEIGHSKHPGIVPQG